MGGYVAVLVLQVLVRMPAETCSLASKVKMRGTSTLPMGSSLDSFHGYPPETPKAKSRYP